MPEIKDLQFIRLTDDKPAWVKPSLINLVPRYLFEQIDILDKDGIDLIYQSSFLCDPLTWFVVMHDQERKPQGFFWAIVCPVEKRIVLYGVSLSKQYQKFKTELNKRIIDYLFSLPINDIYKQTIICEISKAKALEAYGWKRSKRVLMEWTNNVLAESTITVPEDKQPVVSAEPVLAEAQVV